MDTHNIDDIIPEQETGSKSDTEHSATCKDIESAKKLFVHAKERLLDVNNWHQLCGPASAVFKLTDSNGNEIGRRPQEGDHFKIGLPAPGSGDGDGYDWVIIEAIEDKSNPAGDSESVALRVRPTQHPGKKNDDVAHFFKDLATSSFAVEREGRKVTASVHGRNEVPNTKTTGLLDKARNVMVAVGAMLGLSNPQWKSLVKGLLEKRER